MRAYLLTIRVILKSCQDMPTFVYSTNPATGLQFFESPTLSEPEITESITTAHNAFKLWKNTTFDYRKKHMLRLAVLLKEGRDEYATLITREMGCPVSQTRTEIEKCAQIMEYYANGTEEMLADEVLDEQNRIVFEPLGVLFHIAPWNYPFLLALRPLIPAIMAGNTVLLKHASNVPQCGIALEALFQRSGFPEGVFQNLTISARQTAPIIADKRVTLVTLIGSVNAGKAVAQNAGANLKKSIMELGGSDPFIVLGDADLDAVIPAACQSRLRNCGQSCNAAKRFIVMRSIADEFISRLKAGFAKEVIGDPEDGTTTFGPLATASALTDCVDQVEQSLSMGAELVLGGKKIDRAGYYFEPTILTNISRDMPVWADETFSPVAPVYIVESVEEAIEVANDSDFGLTGSIWTADVALGNSLVSRIESGMVTVNTVPRSQIKMPYGGVKMSGYGREMGEYGLKEFVNIKSVTVQK
jgi:succinate-semialdehyde dehydrogenase / glutarate-semialdehyde dehydrogenase